MKIIMHSKKTNFFKWNIIFIYQEKNCEKLFNITMQIQYIYIYLNLYWNHIQFVNYIKIMIERNK